jgi:aspartyl-tRNA(Asn)/glutamyl-tRNA(Gln) amidotransferase subunit A
VTSTVTQDQSCRDRVEAALDAIERIQAELNAFTSVRADEALAEADALDRRADGTPPGRLHGVPVAVKDLFDVAGMPTTGGCAAYQHRIAATDAAVVVALRAAGAVVVAKTNQHELGAGATGLVSCFGPVANPRNPAHIAGGSSSGSAAAVAAGAVPLAIGTDTGGSIRIPAAFCGITGLRPTPGLVSLAGAQPMSPGYDTIGPMAPTADDCAAAFATLKRTAPRATATEPVAGLRIGLPRPYFALVHPETSRAVEAAATALEALGANIDWLDQPDLDADFDGFRHVWADVAHHHRELWNNTAVSDEVAALIDTGRSMDGLAYAASRAHADYLRSQFDDAFATVDVLLTPTTPYAAPHADQERVDVTGGALDVREGGPSRLTVPVNEAGVPAVTFPVGSTTHGLPIGAQLIGPPYSDERLLAVVATYQLDEQPAT